MGDGWEEAEVEMPGIDEPVPPSWTTVSGEFLNVYASKQNWLDYVTLLHPEPKLDDGTIWLVIIQGPATRRKLCSWILNTETAGHLLLDNTKVVRVRAFRFD